MIIKNYKKLIRNSNLRKKALQIVNAGLEAIKTERIIKNRLILKKDILTITNHKNQTKTINLKKYKKIVVVGFGKASSLMAKELELILKDRIDNGLVISTTKLPLKKIKAVKGTHPTPSLKNVKAAKEMVNLIKRLNKDDLVICLVSGGGSALLCYPKIGFKDYMKIINKKFSSGIDINKLNQIRTKLSYVKGGKLADLTKASVISLIFSDVVGDDLKTIASGPTVSKNLKNVKNILLLNNEVALEAMKKKAVSLGLNPVIYSNKIKGEAKNTGKKLLKNLKTNCLLFAGETTVTVKGKGKGGRNQELCLGTIENLSKLKNSVLVAIGSDGRDGPTDAAGAIIDEKSLEKAKKLNYKEYLKNNNTYHFFKKMDDLVFTGLTGSNIADIGVIIKI